MVDGLIVDATATTEHWRNPKAMIEMLMGWRNRGYKGHPASTANHPPHVKFLKNAKGNYH